MRKTDTNTENACLGTTVGHTSGIYPMAGAILVDSFCISPLTPMIVIIRAILKQVAKTDISA